MRVLAANLGLVGDNKKSKACARDKEIRAVKYFRQPSP